MAVRILIEEPEGNEEDTIIIRCRNVDSNILSLISGLKAGGNIVGYDKDSIVRIPPDDVYYFEAVDNKVFIYCMDKVYESKSKLYELEEAGRDYLRISKSVIVNLTKIKSLSPALSGRFEAVLINKEKLIISRQYVPELKHKLGV